MRVRYAAAAALLLVAALALRAFPVTAWPLWLDESWSRWLAEMGWSDLVRSTWRYDTHPPFYYSLLKLWLYAAPHTPGGLRWLSVLAGAATLPLAILCARQVEALRARPALQLAVAGLAAVSPPLVLAAQQARPYALFALAFAAALWLALRLCREGRAATWIGYAAAIEAVLWLHNLGILFAASLFAGLLVALWRGGRLRSSLTAFALVHAAAGLAWLPAFLAILDQRRGWSGGWLRFVPADVPGGLAAGLVAPGAGAVLLLLFALLGAASLVRRSEGPVLVAAALGPAILEILLSALSTPVFLPRTLVPSALPLLLLAGAGIASRRNRRERGAIVFALVALHGLVSLQIARRPAEEPWDRLGAWIAAHAAPGEEVWLVPNELTLPLRYGAPGLALPVRGVPADFPAPDHPGPRYSGTRAVPGVTADGARRLAEDARRRGVGGLWIVSRFPALFDPGDALGSVLGKPDLREEGFAPLLVEHRSLKTGTAGPR